MDAVERGRAAERAESATVESLVRLMDPDLAEQLGVAMQRIGGGLAVRMAAAPGLAYLCRAFALGVDEPLDAGVLGAAVDFLRAAGGSRLLVQVPPFAETVETVQLLEGRGFVRGSTWSKMMRALEDAPTFPTGLRVAEVGREHAERFGEVQVAGMGMPPFMAPWCSAQVGAEGWRTYGAFDGDELVAVGASFQHGDVLQLSGAATLEAYRGRGAQLALMAARMADGLRTGARWVVAETGSETPEEPNPSLHNMRRAGLELLYERQNWLLDV